MAGIQKDNPANVIGADSADNQFASTSVVANANGSMIERLEYIQTVTAAITAGQVILQGAQETATSTTVIKITGLAGYGNDFFNNQFYIQVLANINSAAASPEKETRKITDYVSSTGTFTCDAFGAAVEVGDLCVVLHESMVAVGSDNSNNIFASTNVAANANGSVLERQEYIQTEVDKIGTVTNTAGTATLGAILGDFANDTLVSKVDVIDGLFDVPTADLATDDTMNQVVGKKSDTVAGTSLVAIAKQNAAAIVVVDGLLDVPTEDLATDVTTNQVVGKKSDTTAGTSLVALAKQNAAAIVVVDGLLDVPTEDLATDVTTNQVVGKKSDTVAGTSLVALTKINKAAIDVIDGYMDVPTEDLATDALMSQVVGKKSDTVAGTSLVAIAKQIIAQTVPKAATGETVMDEGDYDWTSAFPEVLTIAPAGGAALTDVVVHFDMDKVTTGFATLYTAETISFYVERKIDGTNWRRDLIAVAAFDGDNADTRDAIINIGDVGITQQARIVVDLSAEVSGTAETDIPYVVYYKGLSAPTITPLTATP